jgi:hypothetical protein
VTRTPPFPNYFKSEPWFRFAAADLLAAIDAVVEPDETRADWIRKVLKLELERRKAMGKTKPRRGGK